jgi:hypothetical protein
MELSTKVEIALWWITSIAISVLCCSVLFVLFASHLVDVRDMVRDTSARIDIITAREDRILAEIELIRKRAVFQVPPSVAGVKAPSDVATDAPMSLSVSGTNPDKGQEVSPTDVPVSVPALPEKAVEPVPAEKKK